VLQESCTPLHVACSCRSVDAALCLLNAEATTDLLDNVIITLNYCRKQTAFCLTNESERIDKNLHYEVYFFEIFGKIYLNTFVYVKCVYV